MSRGGAHPSAGRPRGRPTKAPEGPREVRIQVLLTPREAERLDALRGDVSRSEWLAGPLREMGSGTRAGP